MFISRAIVPKANPPHVKSNCFPFSQCHRAGEIGSLKTLWPVCAGSPPETLGYSDIAVSGKICRTCALKEISSLMELQTNGSNLPYQSKERKTSVVTAIVLLLVESPAWGLAAPTPLVSRISPFPLHVKASGCSGS